MGMKRDKANHIIKTTLELMKKSTDGFPSLLTLARAKITREMVRQQFGTLTDLKNIIAGEYPKEYAACGERKVTDKKRKDTLKLIVDYIVEIGRFPTFMEIIGHLGISRDYIKLHFGSLDKLFNEISKNYRDVIAENMFSSEQFTDKRFSTTLKNIKNYDTFLITTAVAGGAVIPDILGAVRTWENINNGALLVQPIGDPARPKSGQEMFFDPLLRDEFVIFQDLEINKNIKVLSVLNSAKRINPHDAAIRYATPGALSFIASPKQRLTPVATNLQHPGYLASTGAITVNDYSADFYMANALAYEAERFHQYGGIVVKVLGENRYVFTNVTYNTDNGSFNVLGERYLNNGEVEEVGTDVVVIGDLHASMESHERLRAHVIPLLSKLQPKEIFIHDAVSFSTISPFDSSKPFTTFVAGVDGGKIAGPKSLEGEGRWLIECLKLIRAACNAKIFFVPSNHDKFLEYYLDSGRFAKDVDNLELSTALASAYTKNPHQPILKTFFDLINNNHDTFNVEFISTGTSVKRHGIELALHGDKGIRGKKNPSLKALTSSIGPVVVGHGHQSEIYGVSMRVGTMEGVGDERPSYASGGLSDWTHSVVAIYCDGTRQLIHVHNTDYLEL